MSDDRKENASGSKVDPNLSSTSTVNNEVASLSPSNSGVPSGDFFGFLERILSPVVNQKKEEDVVGDKSSDETSKSSRIDELVAEIESLRSQLSNDNSGDDSGGDSGVVDESSGDESSVDESSDEVVEQVTTQQTAFPSPSPVVSTSEVSKKDHFLELSRSNPRRAAIYFKEHGSEILSDARFFGDS